jgi:hypothetical protein
MVTGKNQKLESGKHETKVAMLNKIIADLEKKLHDVKSPPASTRFIPVGGRQDPQQDFDAQATHLLAYERQAA